MCLEIKMKAKMSAMDETHPGHLAERERGVYSPLFTCGLSINSAFSCLFLLCLNLPSLPCSLSKDPAVQGSARPPSLSGIRWKDSLDAEKLSYSPLWLLQGLAWGRVRGLDWKGNLLFITQTLLELRRSNPSTPTVH